MQLQATIATLLQLTLESEEAIQDHLEEVTRLLEGGRMYRFIAASQSNVVLESSVGALGDVISQVLVIPTSGTPGTVSIKDGAGSSMTIFAGTGAQPLALPLNIESSNGAWSVTTGSAVTVLVSGEFS